MINLNAWFQKHDLCAENILYIYRKDRKTVIQRTDGVYTTKAKFLYLSYHSAAFCLTIFYFYFHFITRLTQLLTIVKVLEFKATKLYY